MKRTAHLLQCRPNGWIPAMALVACYSLLVLAPRAVQAEPARYTIDPEHLSIGFLVDHIGYARTLGLFRKAEGSFTFDEQSGELTELEVRVDTASVFTNHKKRDEHLRSADFLNSKEFPEMVFTAQSARRTGDRTFEVAGQLELLGQTRPLVLEATWNKSAEYPFGGGLLGANPYVMGVSARGRITRSAYGMNYAVDNGWVGNEVELIIEFEARRK
ncbi:MAG: YceI family protein [Gammaproteobacteria bacterium]